MKFYLLGYPVEHSVSPIMHNAAFEELGLPHNYKALPVKKETLAKTIDEKIRADSFGGANVTIPYKVEIIKHLDILTESARKIGAINTIKKKNDKLCGYNTDAIGGVRALTENYGELSDSKIVLLGAGGAARALATELAPRVKELTILNRSEDEAEKLVNSLSGNVNYGSLAEKSVIKSADILINTTPVGMYPNINESPVETEYLNKNLLVYDIVYNPVKTKLLKQAEKAGARTLGGLWMLVYQGFESFKIWTGIEPNAETMYKAAKNALQVVGI
jgi:shikimate dehydrogenase